MHDDGEFSLAVQQGSVEAQKVSLVTICRFWDLGRLLSMLRSFVAVLTVQLDNIQLRLEM